MDLSTELRKEYATLFKTCIITPTRMAEVDTCVDALVKYQERYEKIAEATGVPWFLIGLIHCLECGQSFNKHLANGDPLSDRTKKVPKGLPTTGTPPFTFEEGAIAAIENQKLNATKTWTIAEILWALECYNGTGYRAKDLNTPYLWSFSNHYTKGKFVDDHKYDPNAVSAQVGAACILRRLCERGVISVEVKEEDLGWIYAPSKVIPEIIALQKTMNVFPGVYLSEDGKAGPKTSDSYKALTGKYLPGDPREATSTSHPNPCSPKIRLKVQQKPLNKEK